MATLLPKPIRQLYVYRANIICEGQLRYVRFETFIRRIDPYEEYNCADLDNTNTYVVKGYALINYTLFNVRPISKSDPEYIPQLPMQQNFHSGYIAPDYNV
jgi:hypothetical protein